MSRGLRGGTFVLVLAAILLALVSAVATTPGGFEKLKFRALGADDPAEELEAVIGRFNKFYALYFDSGGETMELNVYPATNLVKRRIYHDISTWRKQGHAFMHDNFGTRVTRVEVRSPNDAIVETEEHWVTWIREIATSDKFGGSRNDIQVRYFLTRRDGEWIVWDFRVYGMTEALPPVPDAQWPG